MIRSEVETNIKKQDTISDIIFTILGISLVFNTDNAWFVVMILLISAILLSRIIHCRNVVYYTSTYLTHIEENGGSGTIAWEKNLKTFRKQKFGLPWKGGFVNKINFISYRCIGVIKNFGNLALSTFMIIRLVQIVRNAETNIQYPIIIYIIAGFFYVLNITFTLCICTDKRVREEYEKRWKTILHREHE